MKKSFIKDEKDYKSIAKNGGSVNSKLIRAKYTIGRQKATRLGIIVPNSVIKSAVKRNRFKRVLRAVFRDIKTENKTDLDIVVFAKTGAENLKFNDATDFIKSIVEKP